MENVTSPLTPGLTFSVELVTPEIAAEWLKMVKIEGDIRVQRHQQPKRVGRYAADMAVHQWPFLGDPVRFSAPDDKGLSYFMDGCHRAEAVVESGESIPLLVIRGFPFSLIQQVDVGGRRTFVNYLQMNGVANPGDVAAVTSMLYHWKTGKYGYRGLPRVANPVHLGQDPTHAELWALFKRYPTIPQAVTTAAAVYRRTNKFTVKRSQLALLYVLLGEVDVYKREAFFAELLREEAPIDLQPNYPITTLRDRWGRQGAKAQGEAATLPRWAWLAFMVKTWNAWYEGERLGVLVPGGSQFHTLPKIKGLVETEFEVDEDAEDAFNAEFDKDGDDL